MIGSLMAALAGMDRTLLALLGLAVGLLLATVYFLVRSRMERKRGRLILDTAQAEATRLRTEGRREGEAARNAAIVAGKIEALPVLEELDPTIHRRPATWKRPQR